MSDFFDFKDPNSYSQSVKSEKETRKRFLSYARRIGSEKEMLQLFAKVDGMLRNCADENERKNIAKIFVVEAIRLLGDNDLSGITIDGQLLIKK